MVKNFIALIGKLVIGLLIIILVSQLLFSYLPFSWGSRQLQSKLTFMDQNEIDPNIYFLGSSITNRQLMPSVFDSVVGKSHQTYNLAIDGTMPPHHFYLLENLIERDDDIDYVFMELDGFDHMPPQHFQTTFSKFYFSPRWYFWSMTNLICSPSIGLYQKGAMAYKYTTTVFENIFMISMRLDILKALKKNNVFSFKVLKAHGDGFMYFKSEFTENKKQAKAKNRIINTTKNSFLEASKKDVKELKSNAVYKYLLNSSLEKCKAKGIELIYVINPRHSVLLSAEELLDIKASLPRGKVIDIASPQKYNTLYDADLRYDGDHLNGKGARLYSEILGNIFLNMTTGQNNIKQD